MLREETLACRGLLRALDGVSRGFCGWYPFDTQRGVAIPKQTVYLCVWIFCRSSSDGSYYEKRVDAKGRESEPVRIDGKIPFDVPEGWEWVRLSSLAWFGGGKTPSTADKSLYAECGTLWVTSKDMKRDVIDSTLITLSDRGAALLDKYPVGSIVMVTRSGILRRLLPVAVLAKEATVNQDQKVTIPFDASSSEWLPIVFRAFDYFIRNEFGKAGTTVESVNFELVKRMLVPLPPLAEQRRIAERVAELMPLVEEYGSLEDEREALDAGLSDRLRKSILQEAVRGHLVPQDPSDEPASALLERIRAERVVKVAAGELKAPKGGESVIYLGSDGGYYEKRGNGEPVCIDDEIPFEIPEGWAWARAFSIGQIVGGGTPKTTEPSYWADGDGGIPWLTPADMKHVDGIYVSHGERYITDEGLKSSSTQLLPANSVLMSSRAPIGYLAISLCEMTTNQGFKSIVPDVSEMAEFILWSLDALMDGIKERSSGTTFKEISGSEFGKTLVPIAPLGEQARIVKALGSSLSCL